MCGAPITGRAYRIYVEGTEMIVCERCYRRYMERARRTASDEPLRVRIAGGSSPRHAPAPQQAGPGLAVERREPRRPQQARRRAAPARRRASGGLGGLEKFEVVEDYAIRVRRARERLGLTQKELAVKVKVGENVIKRIEAGTLVPPIDLARRLERVLGVKLLEPVAELEEAEEEEAGGEFYLTLGDVAELRED
ncbi:MAG: TIGR00270 family protein [Crenarchaeota archaeon]|nr:TIGR00270 family protein [Thermoproteota archaeon]